MKKKTVLIFLGLICTALLNAQSLDEMILAAAVRMSNDLPADSTVAIVSVNTHSEELSAYVINELYGAMLRNRKVTPVKFDREQAQYSITGSIEVVGSEYRLSFNAVDENAEIKSRYFASSTGTLTVTETGVSSTSNDRNPPTADTSKQGQILALFGIGGQSLDHENYIIAEYGYEPTTVPAASVDKGTTLGVNVLFVEKSGFTISAGVDIIFAVDTGLNIDPVVGLGYVHYNKFYVGGIINLIPKPYITYDYDEYDGKVHDWWIGDVFFTPTLVAGYDLGGFLLGLQLSYMRGIISGINGFKFSVGAGVNIR